MTDIPARYSATGDRMVELDEVDVVLDDDLPPGFDPNVLDAHEDYLDPDAGGSV